MAFLKRCCPITRYRLLEAPTRDQLGQIVEHLARKGFRSIDTLPDEQSSGWVNFDDPTDSEWRVSAPDRLAHLVFALRHDKRSVPAKLLDVRTRAEIKKFLERRKVEVQDKVLILFANKDEKAEIRERVRLSLLSQATPVPVLADVVWCNPADPATASLWLCSTTIAIQERFQGLFSQTFGLQIRPVTPWSPQPDDVVPWTEEIGRRFLTWLYGHNGDSLDVAGTNMAVDFDRITVADDATKITVRLELEQSRVEELQTAIENGLEATDCDVVLELGGDPYKVRVKGADFAMRVETPFWVYDREDPDGSFADKVLSLDRFFSTWDAVYTLWLREHKYLPGDGSPQPISAVETAGRNALLKLDPAHVEKVKDGYKMGFKNGTTMTIVTGGKS